MCDWRIFLSTFLMVFVAELGDKTQLTVLVQSSSCPSQKWMIFLGGCVALCCATAMGVFGGWLIAKLGISHCVLNIIGGCLFLVFGAWMIWGGCCGR